MSLFGKRQIAVVGSLVAIAFSAGLAQSAFAGASGAPSAAPRAALLIENEITLSEHRGPFGGGGYLAAAAAYIGITEEELRTELQAEKSLVDIAVENRKTREGLIEALAAVATEKIGELVDQKGPFGRPGGPGSGMRVAIGVFGVASDYLGIEREDLLERVRDGETLGEIAGDTEDKSRDGLVEAIVEAANARIDEALANERITEEQATNLKGKTQEMAERAVDADAPFDKPGRGPRFKFGPGRP